MTETVINENEVYLGNTRFPLVGRVRPQLMNRFPQKIAFGDYSYDNEEFQSNWIIRDQRGGIGVGEMDEVKHGDRCWWSDCNIGYDGHIVLPRLANEITLPNNFTTLEVANGGMETQSDWEGDGVYSTNYHFIGSYSRRLYNGNYTSYQDLAGWHNDYRGTVIKVQCFVKSSTPNSARISVTDGLYTTYSSYHTGSGNWEEKTVASQISAWGTKIRLQMHNTAGGGDAYFDSWVIVYQPEMGSIKAANFNGELYLASGNILFKLNSDRTAFEVVYSFEETITDIIASLNSKLYVFLGDSDNYMYKGTTGGFTQSDSAEANWGFQWDSKLFKVKTDGTVKYSTDPYSGSPTWTATGSISDIASQIESFFIGKDKDGNDVVYCATNSRLKMLDFANGKWLDTALILPYNPNGGKGACYWRDGHYISSGLDVRKYVSGYVTNVSEAGLNRDGGIPIEYNGEIIKFCEDGVNEMFALVDAGQVSSDSDSSLMAYDENGWQCWWTSPSIVIEDCEDAWNESVDGDVTSSLDTTDYQAGSGSAKLEVGADCAAGDILATEAISSTDLSGYNKVSLYIKSSVALDSGDLQLLLDDTASCASPLETLNIPAVAADEWTLVSLTLADPSSDTAIISVGIKMAVDKGAFTVRLDQTKAHSEGMHDVIVSPAAGSYAVYWDCGGKIHYIDLHRGIRNPGQLSGTQEYMDSGTHITPWFDAGTAVYPKLATGIKLFVNGITTDETIAVKYRIDHANNDLDTGWSTLGTIDSSTQTVEGDALSTTGGRGTVGFTFGTNEEGETFKSIQFRYDLERGTDTTKTPDIQSVVLSFIKLLDLKWGWNFTVNCGEEYGGNTPRELETALMNAADSNTLLEFTFRNDASGSETHRVKIHPMSGITPTGNNYQGLYQVSVIQP